MTFDGVPEQLVPLRLMDKGARAELAETLSGLQAGEGTALHEAVESGLALRVCAPEELVPATVELAQRIAAHPDASVRATRRLIRESERMAAAMPSLAD